MLVLSRKEGQAVRIGDGITVLVYKIAGNRVRLAFDAPLTVPIVRTELDDLAQFEPPRERPEPWLRPPDFDNVGL